MKGIYIVDEAGTTTHQIGGKVFQSVNDAEIVLRDYGYEKSGEGYVYTKKIPSFFANKNVTKLFIKSI